MPPLTPDQPEAIRAALEKDGYCVVHNVLSPEELAIARDLFRGWVSQDPEVPAHGIRQFKYAGHTRHAWYLRTRAGPQRVFRDLWNTPDLVCSYDGCGYIPLECDRADTSWTHADQSPLLDKLACYQAFIALTHNKERTLVVYEGSHLRHKDYLMSLGRTQAQLKPHWQRTRPEDVVTWADRKRVLEVPAGAMPIWDSRTFHQGQYGKPVSEERMVQYISYLPRAADGYTPAVKAKRQRYFDQMRTTSHWAYPIKVNGLQPQTYGDRSKRIDYTAVPRPNLDGLEDLIAPLI